MSAFPKLVCAARGAAMMSVSKSTFYRLAKQGVIPPPLMLTPSLARWVESDLAEIVTARIAERDRGNCLSS